MRVLSSSFLTVLVLAALLWGNCLSCPQMLLGFSAQVPAHGCCQHSGKQPVTSHEKCTSLGLQHFVKADAAQKVHPPAAQPVPLPAAEPALSVPSFEPDSSIAYLHSPPDLQVLHSTFRI
jgi:hypothetical protein